MLADCDLENLLNAPGISNQNRLLLCLAMTPIQARPTSVIKEIAVNAGWVGVKNVDISVYLNRAKGLAIRKPKGWQLTTPGIEHAAKLSGRDASPSPPQAIQSLRTHLSTLTSPDIRAFVEEAVHSAERKLYRSAVVLSWVGAMAVLHDYVVASKLSEFNAEASKRSSRWKAATTADDLGLLRESDFLQILHAISAIGKSVKEELEACLKFRNGCGHPNSLKITETRVVAHIETLMANVFVRF